MAVCRRDAFLEKIKQRHSGQIGVMKENSGKNADSVIDDVKVPKADSVKISIKRNTILVRFGKHVLALQAPVNARRATEVNFDVGKVTVRVELDSVRSSNMSGIWVSI